ncbi:MAG: ThuA domain-containing protein [Bacteroidales bacterium]|nr:ThuA domain-containing protein [Bacteroidales bacterium]
MKSLSIIFYIALMVWLPLISAGNSHMSESTTILVVTGGHAYDTTAFENMFAQNDNLDVDMLGQPEANEAMENGRFKEYDAVVFYDMWQDITDDQKEAFVNLTKQGIGLVFLHHSLVSYQEWDEFEKILGGRYLQQGYVDDDPALASDFKHDIKMEVSVLDPDHPVTKNMNDFTILDEGYSNLRVRSFVNTLLTTDHPQCAEKVAWTNKYNNSRIVYLLFGHDHKAYQDKNFRRLLFSALEWVSSKSY